MKKVGATIRRYTIYLISLIWEAENVKGKKTEQQTNLPKDQE